MRFGFYTVVDYGLEDYKVQLNKHEIGATLAIECKDNEHQSLENPEGRHNLPAGRTFITTRPSEFEHQQKEIQQLNKNKMDIIPYATFHEK